MSNAALYQRLTKNQAPKGPTEAPETAGKGQGIGQTSITRPGGTQAPITGGEELKAKYNRLLAREKQAEDYLSSPERTQEELNKWLHEFDRICLGLSSLLDQLGSYTNEEANNGFTVQRQAGKTP